MNRALQEALETASSVATFEASSTDGFRQDLASVLIKVVSEECQLTGQNNSSNGIIRYDPSHLSRCLGSSSGIDWKGLCQDHDKRRERFYTATNSSNAACSSPLQEVVNQLFDPRVIPQALASSILFVLVKAFLIHSSSPLSHPTKKIRWNPSQKLLLQAIRRIMTSRQYREELGSIILAVYTSMKTGSSSGDSPNIVSHRIASDPNFRIQRSVYLMIKYFLEDSSSEMTLLSSEGSEYCPILDFLPSLLTFLQYLLSEGANMLPPSSSDHCSARNSHYCRSCGINMELRRMAAGRRKRVACADLAVLHGEVGDDDDDNNGSDNQAKINSSLGPRSMYHTTSSKPITLKSVIQAKDTDDLPRNSTTPCPNCQHVATPHHGRSNIPDESTISAWCQLRDKCIHTMISSFQSAKFLPQRRPYRLLQAIISVACNSPCLRLCTLQLAHILGDRGYQYLISSLWQRATEQNAAYFTWYAEVVANSTFCNKREHCWEAMQPLIKQVRALCKEDGKGDNNNNRDIQNERASCMEDPPFIPYLGYILSRRCRLLQSISDDEISRVFSSLVTELSWTFGDANDWIAPWSGIDSDSEQHIVESLHSLGILSAFSEVQYDVEGDEEEGSGRTNITPHRAHFVPDLKGLHRVYKQMINSSVEAVGFNAHSSSASMLYALNQSLLSDLNHDERQVIPLTAKPTEGDVQDKGEVIPMLHMLDNDVLRNVFSFLGYKKLAKIRGVCSTWKELSDEDRSWLPIYRRRFGLAGLDEAESKAAQATTGEVTPSLWKSRFVSKWLAERQVRFKVNKKKNFKYQICKYVDCQHVIISPEHIRKHHFFHRKQKALQERRKCKIESKKEGKAVKRATPSSKKRKSPHPASAAKKKPRHLNPCTSCSPKHAKPVVANAMAS